MEKINRRQRSAKLITTLSMCANRNYFLHITTNFEERGGFWSKAKAAWIWRVVFAIFRFHLSNVIIMLTVERWRVVKIAPPIKRCNGFCMTLSYHRRGGRLDKTDTIKGGKIKPLYAKHNEVFDLKCVQSYGRK